MMNTFHMQNRACHSLTAHNFRKIAPNGFGDPYNAYPHSMAWFQDHLYVGVTRACLAYRGRQRAEDTPDLLCSAWPVKIPKGIWDIDLRAQIWRYHPLTDTWSKVFTSPMVKGIDGFEVPLSVCVRAMATFQGRSDSIQSLYVPTMATYQTAAVMLRSTDGVNFEVVTEEGMGFPEPYKPRGVRALATFKGLMFTSPAVARKRKSYNFGEAMVIMVTDDPSWGKWELACEPSFGDPNNLSVFHMAEFDGHLYAGTMNVNEGFQVWKTDAEGAPPFKWEKVMTNGAYRGKLNQGAITLQPFRGCLYIGSGIQDGGWDLQNSIGPAAIEVIRLNPDDSWDIIVGEPRITPEGLKVPLSGLGPGFENPFAGYLWSMCEHEGWLYAGTFNWLTGTKYSRRDLWPENLQRNLPLKRVNEIVYKFGGFDLWRSNDGYRWIPVTQNGFGNYYNYGVRTMLSTTHGLFVGVTNPFGPEVAVRRIAGWKYEINPRSGLEIWLGSHISAVTELSETSTGIPDVRTRSSLTSKNSKESFEESFEKIVDQFYGGSGFCHFGFWREDIDNAKTACENLMDEILAFIPEKKGTIVDIGCGLGATTKYLLMYFSPEMITGITTSNENLEACRKKVPDVKFLYRNLNKLGLPRDSFDFVILVRGLEELPPRWKLLHESFRILKPGGLLVCFDVLYAARTMDSVWKYLLSSKSSVETLEKYRELLLATGFQDVQLADVTSESLGGFRKHVARYFEAKKLSGEIEANTLQEVETYLLMHNTKTPISQCLLVSGYK